VDVEEAVRVVFLFDLGEAGMVGAPVGMLKVGLEEVAFGDVGCGQAEVSENPTSREIHLRCRMTHLAPVPKRVLCATRREIIRAWRDLAENPTQAMRRMGSLRSNRETEWLMQEKEVALWCLRARLCW
jgi:hypothetical protein